MFPEVLAELRSRELLWVGGWGQQPRPGQGLLGSASLDARETKLPLLQEATPERPGLQSHLDNWDVFL